MDYFTFNCRTAEASLVEFTDNVGLVVVNHTTKGLEMATNTSLAMLTIGSGTMNCKEARERQLMARRMD